MSFANGLSASNRSATSSSEPRFSSQRRPRPGEYLPDHLGGEGQFPSLCDVRDPRGLQIGVPWLGAPGADRDRGLSDAWLTSRIKEIHENARGVYGSRRVQAELRLGQGIVVSRKRIRRLMRHAGISGLVKVKKGRTTIRVPGVRVADDLVERRFKPDTPNVLWVADITYLGPGRGGSTSPPSRTPIRVGSSGGR